MNIESKKEFELRFYNWALEDSQRELNEDFPFLRTFKTGLGKGALDRLLLRANEERQQLMKALVKRFWFTGLLNEKAEMGEKILIKSFLGEISIPSHEEIMLNETEIRFPNRFKINRKELLDCVRLNLEPKLGSAFQKMGGNVWKATVIIEGWELITVVDLGSSSHQIDYYHTLGKSGEYVFDHQISLLSWLGIGGQTSWSGLEETDVHSAVNNLGNICGHFLKHVPLLLDGIKP